MFLVRPLTVYLSTIGTGIPWQERALLGWIAPRGIVAAAVAGLFAPRMMESRYAGAEKLLPLVFALIVVTVVLHGLSINWLSRKLGLHPNTLMVYLLLALHHGLWHWQIYYKKSKCRLY